MADLPDTLRFVPLVITDCPFCGESHTTRYLCDPAKAVLDALLARGMLFNQESIEFPDPVEPFPALGSEPGDALLRQLLVQAATVEDGAGNHHAMLIFTGQDIQGTPLPRWLYAATGADLRRTITTVEEMSELALRTARQKNGGR